jgi:hypothetical protein
MRNSDGNRSEVCMSELFPASCILCGTSRLCASEPALSDSEGVKCIYRASCIYLASCIWTFSSLKLVPNK